MRIQAPSKAAPSASRKMSYGWDIVLAKAHRDFLMYSLRLSWADFCAPLQIFLWKSPDGQEKI
jgi:hypothetical protein